jgi:hypothetical protein
VRPKEANRLPRSCPVMWALDVGAMVPERGRPHAARHVWSHACVPIIQKTGGVDKDRHVCAETDAHMGTIEWGSQIEHALSVVVHARLKTRRKLVLGFKDVLSSWYRSVFWSNLDLTRGQSGVIMGRNYDLIDPRSWDTCRNHVPLLTP